MFKPWFNQTIQEGGTVNITDNTPPTPVNKPTDGLNTKEGSEDKIDALAKENAKLQEQLIAYKMEQDAYIKAKTERDNTIAQQAKNTDTLQSIEKAANEFIAYKEKYPEIKGILDSIGNSYPNDALNRLNASKKAIIGELGGTLIKQNTQNPIITQDLAQEIIEFESKTPVEQQKIIQEGTLQKRIEDAYFGIVKNNMVLAGQKNIQSAHMVLNGSQKLFAQNYHNKKVTQE